MTNVKEQNIENRNCFNKYFASYIFVSSGPKKSNTNFSKKRLSSRVTKDFGLIFFELSVVKQLKGRIVWVQKVILQNLLKF